MPSSKERRSPARTLSAMGCSRLSVRINSLKRFRFPENGRARALHHNQKKTKKKNRSKDRPLQNRGTQKSRGAKAHYIKTREPNARATLIIANFAGLRRQLIRRIVRRIQTFQRAA